MKMTLELAKKLIQAAQKKAEEMKIPSCIAVVDEGANLVAFERMDGAMITAIDISICKAYTSAASTFATDDLGKLAQPGELAFGIANCDKGRVIIFAGGLPIKSGGKVIGGIGSSGGLATDDKIIAEAGLTALE